MFFESFCISRFGKIGNKLSCKRIYAAKTCNPFFLSLLAVNKRLLAFFAPLLPITITEAPVDKAGKTLAPVKRIIGDNRYRIWYVKRIGKAVASVNARSPMRVTEAPM
jgi:hypothetical protein